MLHGHCPIYSAINLLITITRRIVSEVRLYHGLAVLRSREMDSGELCAMLAGTVVQLVWCVGHLAMVLHI